VSSVAIVWLVVAVLSTAAVAAVLIALIRHVIVLVRALGRFQAEVTPIAEEIGRQGDRASRRVPTGERPFGRPRGRAVR